MCKWCKFFGSRSKSDVGTDTSSEKNKKRLTKKHKDLNDKNETEIGDGVPTREYEVPSDEYKKKVDVFRKLGFDSTDEPLGKGGFGVVEKLRRIIDEREFACKQIKLKGKDKDMKKAMQEISTMTNIKHENIIQLETHFIINFIKDKQIMCYIIMELANGGSLWDEARKRGKTKNYYSEDVLRDYFAQLVRGLDYLHFKGIAHRDLKLANVLICKQSDNNKVLKLCDFGTSHVAVKDKNKVIKTQKFAGTLNYMSPEVLKWYLKAKLKYQWSDRLRSVNSFMADIWALGVCLYYMLFFRFPFGPIGKNKTNQKFLVNLLDRQIKKDFKIDKIIGNISLNIYCEEILVEMLEPDRFLRIDISDVKCHPWLKGMITVDVDRYKDN